MYIRKRWCLKELLAWLLNLERRLLLSGAVGLRSLLQEDKFIFCNQVRGLGLKMDPYGGLLFTGSIKLVWVLGFGYVWFSKS